LSAFGSRPALLLCSAIARTFARLGGAFARFGPEAVHVFASA
jgi:hypothetical protein